MKALVRACHLQEKEDLGRDVDIPCYLIASGCSPARPVAFGGLADTVYICGDVGAWPLHDGRLRRARLHFSAAARFGRLLFPFKSWRPPNFMAYYAVVVGDPDGHRGAGVSTAGA